jgi:hypothetical protein
MQLRLPTPLPALAAAARAAGPGGARRVVPAPGQQVES